MPTLPAPQWRRPANISPTPQRTCPSPRVPLSPVWPHPWRPASALHRYRFVISGTLYKPCDRGVGLSLWRPTRRGVVRPWGSVSAAH